MSFNHLAMVRPVPNLLLMYGKIALFLLLLIVIGIPLEGRAYQLYIDEHGLIESLSVGLHLVNATLLMLFGKNLGFRAWPYGVVICLFFAFREMDFDKVLFSFGMLKGRFFFLPEVPVMEKLVAGTIILTVLFSVLQLLRLALVVLVPALKQANPMAWASVLSVMLIIISKSLDGISRKLGAWGIEINARLVADLNVVEEVLELGIGWVILAALLALKANQLENAPPR